MPRPTSQDYAEDTNGGGVVMMVQRAARRKSAAKILESQVTPLDKIRRLVALGYEEIDADAMVASLQVGPNQMMYYEQLPEPEYEEG
jgi:hypothetical protein